MHPTFDRKRENLIAANFDAYNSIATNFDVKNDQLKLILVVENLIAANLNV